MRVRPATTGDVDAITQLMNAHGTAVHGESEAAPTAVLEWLEDPELVIRLGERDGKLACYGDIMFSADGTRANLDIREHPDAPASAGPMLEELEAIANERGATKAWAFHASEERELAALVRARGYTPIRHSFRMLVRLDAAPEPAGWPEGTTVREMRESEQRATHAAGNEAFADHWEFEPTPYERFARWNFEGANFDRSLNFLALEGDEIAGICLCSMHWSPSIWPSMTTIRRRAWRPSRRRAMSRRTSKGSRIRTCRRASSTFPRGRRGGAIRMPPSPRRRV